MALPEIRPAQWVGTILSGNVTGSISGGQLADVATIGTILSPIAISNLSDVGTLGTILSPVAIATILSPIPIGNINDIGTIGTILSMANTAYEGTVGTLLSGFITIQQAYVQTNIKTNFLAFANFAATLVMGTLQDLVVDALYGSIIAGSIQTTVMGVEAQTGKQTSTIVGGGWGAGNGNLNVGQRLVIPGPTGLSVAVQVNVPGSISGVYVTAVQSTSG